MTTQEETIKKKLNLLEFANIIENVTRACEIKGYSRDSFYRFKALYERGGKSALKEISRRKPIEKNRVNELVENEVVKMAMDMPAFGQLRVSNELKKQGIIISPGGVRSVWLRHNLETFQKRLKALSIKVIQEGIILTDEQITVFERAKAKKVTK